MVMVQLLTPTKTAKDFLETDLLWVSQPKIDGIRLLIDVSESQAYNRSGEPVFIDFPIEPFSNHGLDGWVLDGEWLNGTYYIFDGYNVNDSKAPFSERYQSLSDALCGLDGVHQLVPYQTDKQAHLDALRASGAEGIVFRQITSRYWNGRSPYAYKYKFTKDVDCVVTEVGTEKINLRLGMYDRGELTDVGSVSAQTADGPTCKVGDVVKVNILYASASNRLYQPVLPRIRTDKKAQDCTIDQLDAVRVNKEVTV